MAIESRNHKSAYPQRFQSFHQCTLERPEGSILCLPFLASRISCTILQVLSGDPNGVLPSTAFCNHGTIGNSRHTVIYRTHGYRGISSSEQQSQHMDRSTCLLPFGGISSLPPEPWAHQGSCRVALHCKPMAATTIDHADAMKNKNKIITNIMSRCI